MAKHFHSDDVISYKTDFNPLKSGRNDINPAFLQRRRARAERRARRAL